jgi:osmotically-inducible protein OsmY
MPVQMKKLSTLLLLFSAALSPMARAAADKTPPSDDRILDQVRMRLTTDADVKGGSDEVIVKDGVVTIRGRVGSERGKSKATKLAKKVKGVKAVENELVVGPPK